MSKRVWKPLTLDVADGSGVLLNRKSFNSFDTGMDALSGASPATRSTGGPHGLGDPDDRSLRKVEVEVLIPKIMRDRAKIEKCIPEVKAFEDCCKDNSLLMVINCRNENSALKSCFAKWYQDETFKNECKEIYLKERSEFRRTGISKKKRMLEENTK